MDDANNVSRDDDAVVWTFDGCSDAMPIEDAPSYCIAGIVGGVTVYSRALTPGEIRRRYLNTRLS